MPEESDDEPSADDATLTDRTAKYLLEELSLLEARRKRESEEQ
jgi:hypothetical protein